MIILLYQRFIYVLVLDYDVSYLTPVNDLGEEISDTANEKRYSRQKTNLL